MQKNERDQLGYLAELYSLNMKLTETSRKGLTCPVLTKTRYLVVIFLLSFIYIFSIIVYIAVLSQKGICHFFTKMSSCQEGRKVNKVK